MHRFCNLSCDKMMIRLCKFHHESRSSRRMIFLPCQTSSNHSKKKSSKRPPCGPIRIEMPSILEVYPLPEERYHCKCCCRHQHYCHGSLMHSCFFPAVVPDFCTLWFSPVSVAMISSLLVSSHRVLTCRGSVVSTTRWRSRSGCARRRA